MRLRKRFNFSHVVSNDLRVFLNLHGAHYLTPNEALESFQTNMYVLVLMPKDSKTSCALLNHIRKKVLTSSFKSAALVVVPTEECNNFCFHDYQLVGNVPVDDESVPPRSISLWKIGNFP